MLNFLFSYELMTMLEVVGSRRLLCRVFTK